MITESEQGKRKKYQYNDGIYDSKEEIYFVWWLNEMFEKGILEWEYQPSTYSLCDPVKISYIKQLKTKEKICDKSLLLGHSYTPDFKIFWRNLLKTDIVFRINVMDSNIKAPFFAQFDNGKWISIVDVKGKYAKHQSHKFPLDQKWMMQKHGIYVNKIVPQRLFRKTFIPERYKLTDKKTRDRKINIDSK